MMKPKSMLRLVYSIIVCLLAWLIGSLFTFKSIPTWYAGLNKAAFNPPNWLFGPVWTLLYILMAIALYIFWEQSDTKKTSKMAFALFGLQLALNALWSILFFGLRNPLAAFIEIVMLWVSILLTIVMFGKTSKTAAYLLVPYILWVSFAVILNLYVILLN